MGKLDVPFATGSLDAALVLPYGFVVSEPYSPLMDAIALLVVLAALMYLTRRVDWYTYATS